MKIYAFILLCVLIGSCGKKENSKFDNTLFLIDLHLLEIECLKDKEIDASPVWKLLGRIKDRTYEDAKLIVDGYYANCAIDKFDENIRSPK